MNVCWVSEILAMRSKISHHSCTIKILVWIKGQIISEWFFGVFNFLQKTNENKSIWGIIVVKSNSFIRFLEEIDDIKTPFEINWPLGA